MKTGTSKLIFPEFIEEKYGSTGDSSLSTHWTSTLSIVQIVYIL